MQFKCPFYSKFVFMLVVNLLTSISVNRFFFSFFFSLFTQEVSVDIVSA